MNKIHLLIIDPQVDFCDKNGSLYVKGAEDDMDRLALMVSRLKNKIDDIHVTMDSHRVFDVAHPIYWVNSSGKNPTPFTIIQPEDVENGTWQPSVPDLFDRSLNYVKTLKANGRYDLCIWPEHCRIGTPGHTIVEKLMDALTDWERSPAMVDMVTKGSNPYTEHYSAIKSEVEDPEDESTQLNTRLIKTLMEADIVAIAGEASSHCVANTVLDIANNFGDDDYIKKLVFLKDSSSPVTGFEAMEDKFLKEMTSRGMRVSSTKEFLA